MLVTVIVSGRSGSRSLSLLQASQGRDPCNSCINCRCFAQVRVAIILNACNCHCFGQLRIAIFVFVVLSGRSGSRSSCLSLFRAGQGRDPRVCHCFGQVRVAILVILVLLFRAGQNRDHEAILVFVVVSGRSGSRSSFFSLFRAGHGRDPCNRRCFGQVRVAIIINACNCHCFGQVRVAILVFVVVSGRSGSRSLSPSSFRACEGCDSSHRRCFGRSGSRSLSDPRICRRFGSLLDSKMATFTCFGPISVAILVTCFGQVKVAILLFS